MAVRKPLVSISGQIQEIPSGDTISGTADKADLAGSTTQNFSVARLGISVSPVDYVGAYMIASPTTASGGLNYGMYMRIVGCAAATTAIYAMRFLVDTEATEYAVTNVYGADCIFVTNGQGCIVTNYTAYNAPSETEATNCYAFYGLNAVTPEDNLGTTSTITNIAVASNKVTVTTAAAHGLTAETSRVTITPGTNTQLQGSGILVASTPSGSSFTYSRTTADVASMAETGSVVPQKRWNLYMAGTAPNYLAGDLYIPAGTAAAPSLAKTTDTDTGLYFPAANEVALAAAGAQVIKADSAGAHVTGTLEVTAAITSSGATSGIGYATGAGGTVTQATSRTTGVTLNKATGAITLVSAAGSTTPASFTVTNSAVAATDVIIINQKSGTDLYEIHVTAVAAGSFRVTSKTTGGTTTEQPVFGFAVIKGVAA